ncbi:hypothetical protein LMG22037_05553 [Paraburkholderia phenoliruptrix]|uniref:Pilin accessory protein (PilO) n=2 Tax=Paraburkholderia phenoliruptrix TaxID=252970 RepID=A0A6J5CA29_9BURK|nr:hypothetical protein LMG22037_05553 [Paraburkholderia phenoliruptrix]
MADKRGSWGSRMAQTLAIPGIKGEFAAGLSWRTETRWPKPDALRAWSVRGGRWGLVYKTGEGRTQVGLCAPIAGFDRPGKLRSLAASVASQRVAPWRAVYDLGDGRFWYIAVRDRKAIIPDGDQIGTKSDIDRVWNSHSKLGNWNEVSEGTVEDIVDMVLAASTMPSLRDLQSRPWFSAVKLAVVGAAAALLATAAVWGVRKGLAYIRHTGQAATHGVALSVPRRPAVSEALAHPWAHEPAPSAAFDACHRAWSTQALSDPGWPLTSWSCSVTHDGISVAAGWLREDGLATDAPGVLAQDGQSASASTVIAVRFEGASAPPDATRLASRKMAAFAQSRGFPITFDGTGQPALPGAAPSASTSSAWTSSNVTLEVPWAPWLDLKQAFDNVDGLRIRSISWQSATETWTVAGTLYGLNRTPSSAHGDIRPVAERSQQLTIQAQAHHGNP